MKSALCPQVVVPTRVGQGYVYEAAQPEQDEYDIPRHLLAPGSQDIYDVPPVRGLLPSQYGQEVGVGCTAVGGQGGESVPLLDPGQGTASSQPWPGLGAVPWGFCLSHSPWRH